MRIAQIATLDTPVRAEHSGSIEQHVWLLDRELTRLGHEVTVFAAAGSSVSGRLVETLPGTYAEDGVFEDWRLCEWVNICRALELSAEFDIIHSHGYLFGIPLELLSKAPLIHTLHVTPYDEQMRIWSMRPDAWVTAISTFQWNSYPNLKPCGVIPHGIDPEQFSFCADPEEYLCYLGRFIPDKGVLAAISVARVNGIPLKLAGPRNDYFTETIEPLVDGDQVQYVGAVTGAERNRFLGNAIALLYPVEVPEPFGLVQIEAMMCGTPVVANRLGAVAEIIDEGITGFSTGVREELATLIPKARSLDRSLVRKQALARFSVERMTAQYVEIYTRRIAAVRRL